MRWPVSGRYPGSVTYELPNLPRHGHGLPTLDAPGYSKRCRALGSLVLCVCGGLLPMSRHYHARGRCFCWGKLKPKRRKIYAPRPLALSPELLEAAAVKMGLGRL